MRPVWIALGLLLFAFGFWRTYGSRSSAAPLSDLPAPMAEIRRELLENRGSTLAVRPRAAGLVAVAVEEADDSGIVLVIALADSSARAYSSEGETLISTAGRVGQRRTAGSMYDRAARLMANAEPVSRFPLPRSGMVRMYFVTANGIRMTEASVRILESEFPNEQALELSGLFGNAMSLVQALR